MDFMKGTLFGEAFANSLVQKAWYKDLNRIVTQVNAEK